MAGTLRLVFDPVGVELDAARACEADVFLQTYSNTVEQFDDEYGPYSADTGFMAVLDEDGTALATTRFIAPGAAGLKTLNDVARPPWGVDGIRAARAAGMDPARTWDIATISVRRSAGRGGLCAAALYHGIIASTQANGIDDIVMIMDARARRLLFAAGFETWALPGCREGEYLGSARSLPIWTNVAESTGRQRTSDPDAYRLITQGHGLDVDLPQDWVWHRASVEVVDAHRDFPMQGTGSVRHQDLSPSS